VLVVAGVWFDEEQRRFEEFRRASLGTGRVSSTTTATTTATTASNDDERRRVEFARAETEKSEGEESEPAAEVF
jgi:hypothetical protein